MTSDDAPAARRDRRRWWRPRYVVLGLFLLVVVLGVLAVPIIRSAGDARAARADLTQAMSALQAGDVDQARAAARQARAHVDEAVDGAQGIGGDVWSRLPLIGVPVADARHLVEALDDLTAVAEVGVDVYPLVTGPRATLFRDRQVDRATLDEAVAGAAEAGSHLRSASAALAEVRGSTPVIGSVLADQRDVAAARVDPAAEAFTRLEPMLDQLPDFFGFEGRRDYLIALLNPAELRYSGGAALSFAPVRWDEGRVSLGDSITPLKDRRLSGQLRWPKVNGNDFHRSVRGGVAQATYAPSWSISGRELLRAWEKATGEDLDGLLTIDVVGLGDLLEATGPITTPGYGRLTAANLAETLIGSYDDYYPDAQAQDELNDQLIPAFQDRILDGGGYLDKGRALGKAAAGRHFATFFRDQAVQEGFAALGLSGDLADRPGDYLFVGTQNLNGSKADYWQRRTLRLESTLATDGSAENRLEVVIDNDSPPYDLPVADPRSGYFTRWAGMDLTTFLPAGVTSEDAALDGKPFTPTVREHYQHSFVTQELLLGPQAEGTLRMRYDVPAAASVADSGDLTYRLTLEPQGTVVPARVDVTVRLPQGYRAAELPEGWRGFGGALHYRTRALEASQDWEITLEADN